MATTKLYKLKPVTPPLPKKLIIKPPKVRPQIPTIISITTPILLPIIAEASQPAKAPKTIQSIIPIYFLINFNYCMYPPRTYFVIRPANVNGHERSNCPYGHAVPIQPYNIGFVG